MGTFGRLWYVFGNSKLGGATREMPTNYGTVNNTGGSVTNSAAIINNCGSTITRRPSIVWTVHGKELSIHPLRSELNHKLRAFLTVDGKTCDTGVFRTVLRGSFEA